MLAHYVDEIGNGWEKALQSVTFAYNAASHDTTKHSPCMLLFGWEPTLPTDVGLELELIARQPSAQKLQEIKRLVEAAQEKRNKQNAKRYNLRHRKPRINIGSIVLVKDMSHLRGRTN